jgi:hypothetical membrane protein
MTSTEHRPERGVRAVRRPVDTAVRWCALAGVGGPIVFVVAFTAAGLLRPGFSPIRKSISSLGVGPGGLLERVPAVVTGLLIVVFVASFVVSMRAVLSPATRWAGATLLALPGLGLATTGIFTAARSTVAIHSVASSLGLLGGAIGLLVTGLGLRRDARWRGWGTYSLLASLVTFGLLLLEFLAANPHAPLAAAPIGGLVERLLVTELLAWYVVVGWRLFRA